MKITVTAGDPVIAAKSDTGTEVAIKFGPNKPAGDTTMNPVELFLSSLGMCIGAMLRSFCDTHQLDCGHIKVTVTGEWEGGAPLCDNIKAVVEIPGEWEDRRKAAFLKVAMTCPVHHTIATCGEIDIEVK